LLGKEKQAKETGYFNTLFSTPSTSCSVSETEIGSTDEEQIEQINLMNSAIECVRSRDATDCLGNAQIVIELRRSTISSPALKAHLDFLYTGELPKEISTQIEVGSSCRCSVILKNYSPFNKLLRNIFVEIPGTEGYCPTIWHNRDDQVLEISSTDRQSANISVHRFLRPGLYTNSIKNMARRSLTCNTWQNNTW